MLLYSNTKRGIPAKESNLHQIKRVDIASVLAFNSFVFATSINGDQIHHMYVSCERSGKIFRNFT